jgi:hypothetical protein
MKILGITGSLNLVHEDSDGDHHDAAAVLVVDGKVAAAIEEERLNRIKHTDKFPVNAIRFVLQQQDLNTSFNNNVEPIVDSIADAIICYLTTKLNYLVIGDYLIHKKDVGETHYIQLVPALPVHNVLIQTNRFVSLDKAAKLYEIKNNFDNGFRSSLSAGVFHLLNEMNDSRTLGELMGQKRFDGVEEKKALLDEILELWKSRFITMNPHPTG